MSAQTKDQEIADLFGCAIGSPTFIWATQKEQPKVDSRPDIDYYDTDVMDGVYDY